MTRFDALKIIHEYYPVGLPYQEANFEGYGKIARIVKEKQDYLVNGGEIEPWNSFFNTLQNQYEKTQIVNLSHLELPCLSLIFPLNSYEENFVIRRTWIKVYLSLLTPLYTIILEEEFIYDPKLGNSAKNIISSFIRPNYSSQELDIIDKIKSNLLNFYPNIIFIDYAILKIKIKGAIPFGESNDTINTEFPIFDFIFGFLQ